DGMVVAQASRAVPLAAPVLAEGVELAVAEVADDQTAAEPSEILWRHRHAPGRVQQAVRADPRDEVAVGIELPDEAVSDPGDVVLAALQRVADEDRVADGLDAEGA